MDVVPRHLVPTLLAVGHVPGEYPPVDRGDGAAPRPADPRQAVLHRRRSAATSAPPPLSSMGWSPTLSFGQLRVDGVLADRRRHRVMAAPRRVAREQPRGHVGREAARVAAATSRHVRRGRRREEGVDGRRDARRRRGRVRRRREEELMSCLSLSGRTGILNGGGGAGSSASVIISSSSRQRSTVADAGDGIECGECSEYADSRAGCRGPSRTAGGKGSVSARGRRAAACRE